MTALRNAIGEDEAAEQATAQDASLAPWSTAEMLLAAIADQLARGNWLYVAAHSKSARAAGKPPEPIRRPGATGKQAPRGLTDEQRRRLDPRLRLVPDDGESGGIAEKIIE